MARINLGIVSQTPFIRMLKPHNAETVALSSLKKSDYTYTTGGVAPMVKAQLDEFEKERKIRHATWISLNPNAPRNIILSKTLNMASIRMEDENSRDYVSFKEKLWNNMHNIKTMDFTIREYLGYFRYNSKLARIMLQDYESMDLFEIHDFQQILLGSMLGPSFPTILRWHGPFVPETFGRKVKKFIVNGLEGNDAVIVSTNRDLEGLLRAGYRGRAYQIYPHIDPSIWKPVRKSSVSTLSDMFGIKPNDFLILNVARMDEIKSQDDLIKAVAMIKEPNVKLMLVGGDSFTTKALGHSKGVTWSRKLRSLVKRLKVEGKVIFAGNVGHDLLSCAYERADLFVLPSRTEGFALVVVEGWMYETPAIVSEGAGVSELVTDGFNGFVSHPGKFKDLAAKIHRLYKDDSLRLSMGINARNTANICNVAITSKAISKAYNETLSEFNLKT